MKQDFYAQYPSLYAIYEQINQFEKKINELQLHNIGLNNKLRELREKYYKTRQDDSINFYESKRKFIKEIKHILNEAKYQCIDYNQLVLQKNQELKSFIEQYKNISNYNCEKTYNEINKVLNEIKSNHNQIKILETDKKLVKKQIIQKRRDLKSEIDKNYHFAVSEYKKEKKSIKKQLIQLKKQLHQDLSKVKKNDISFTFVKDGVNTNLKSKKSYCRYLRKKLLTDYAYNKQELKKKLTLKRYEIYKAKTKEPILSKEKIVNYFDASLNQRKQSRFTSSLIRTFIFLLPIILIGQVFVFINEVILNYSHGGFLNYFYKSVDFILILNWIKVCFGYLQTLINSTSLFVCVIFSYLLASSYKINKQFTIATSLLAFFIISVNDLTTIPISEILSTKGLVSGILVPIVVTFMFYKLNTIFWIRIRFKRRVSDRSTELLNNTIQFVIIIITFAVVSIIVCKLGAIIIPRLSIDEELIASNLCGEWTISSIINLFLQIPIAYLKIKAPLLSIILMCTLLSSIYYFGVNGFSVIGSLMWNKFGWWNNNGIEAHNFFNNIVSIIYVQNGGVGATFALMIAILLFSKRKSWINVSKISFLLVLFQINETLLFGLPIVFNPLLAIPFILAPITGILITYFGFSMGLVPPPHIDGTITIPWTLPPIIGALLVNDWNYKAGILSAFIIIVQFLIYTPFVLMDNKVYAKNFENVKNNSLIFKHRANELLASK